MAKQKSCLQKDPARLNKVGGQAVLEGVMMKAGEKTVTTCRKEDGSLVVTDSTFVSVRKKCKILNIPIIRGVVNFIEMLLLSFKTLSISADALEIEEEEGKVEKWLKKHIGVRLTDVIMVIGLVLGVALALFLFMFLPTALASFINHLAGGVIPPTLVAVIEGAVKVVIFVSYLYLVSLIPDIKRTFMYHGAEHKSIACFEAGGELTPENAKNYTRFHPRCGTSFMFFMILLGIIAGIIIRNVFSGLNDYLLAAIRVLILPLVMGLGYEYIMFAGKHDNFITRILSTPGLWMQRITTREPTEDMLEVAITSIKCALRDDFPEFGKFYKNREWEKHSDSDVSDNEDTPDAAEGSCAEQNTEDCAEAHSECDVTEKEPCECKTDEKVPCECDVTDASEEGEAADMPIFSDEV